MKFTAWLSIIVGFLMIVQWMQYLVYGQVPELMSEPIRILFHILAEGITAAVLIVSGALLLKRRRWAREASFTALGMLLYTLIVSPGYFAQLGEWAAVGMFALLFFLTLGCIWILFRSQS